MLTTPMDSTVMRMLYHRSKVQASHCRPASHTCRPAHTNRHLSWLLAAVCAETLHSEGAQVLARSSVLLLSDRAGPTPAPACAGLPPQGAAAHRLCSVCLSALSSRVTHKGDPLGSYTRALEPPRTPRLLRPLHCDTSPAFATHTTRNCCQGPASLPLPLPPRASCSCNCKPFPFQGKPAAAELRAVALRSCCCVGGHAAPQQAAVCLSCVVYRQK